MTENEAIEELRDYRACSGTEFPTEIEMAITALEEIQVYRKEGLTIEKVLDMMCDLASAEGIIEECRAIGTVEECRAAVERMKPKPLVEKRNRKFPHLGTLFYCECGVAYIEPESKYCGNCGQRLQE